MTGLWDAWSLLGSPKTAGITEECDSFCSGVRRVTAPVCAKSGGIKPSYDLENNININFIRAALNNCLGELKTDEHYFLFGNNYADGSVFKYVNMGCYVGDFD